MLWALTCATIDDPHAIENGDAFNTDAANVQDYAKITDACDPSQLDVFAKVLSDLLNWTLYLVMTEPPLSGAAQETVTLPLANDTVGIIGALGDYAAKTVTTLEI